MIAELLRANGESVLLQGGDASTAEAYFQRALDWTHRQGALSWELRAATSFAQVLRDQGRAADALLALQPVFDRFIEGFDTADVKAERALSSAPSSRADPPGRRRAECAS
jgi:predicted ATPase